MGTIEYLDNEQLAVIETDASVDGSCKNRDGEWGDSIVDLLFKWGWGSSWFDTQNIKISVLL